MRRDELPSSRRRSVVRRLFDLRAALGARRRPVFRRLVKPATHEFSSAAPTRAQLRVGSLASFPSFPLGLVEVGSLRAFYSNNSVGCCFWGTRRPCWASACRAVSATGFGSSAKTELPALLLLRTATGNDCGRANGLAFVPHPSNNRLSCQKNGIWMLKKFQVMLSLLAFSEESRIVRNLTVLTEN